MQARTVLMIAAVIVFALPLVAGPSVAESVMYGTTPAGAVVLEQGDGYFLDVAAGGPVTLTVRAGPGLPPLTPDMVVAVYLIRSLHADGSFEFGDFLGTTMPCTNPSVGVADLAPGTYYTIAWTHFGGPAQGYRYSVAGGGATLRADPVTPHWNQLGDSWGYLTMC